jgi:hypothetical protein
MILLYCDKVAAVVLAVHEDIDGILKSAYGANARIIPWPNPLNSLAQETTGYKRYIQPTETPTILRTYAAQLRWEHSVSGISFVAASGTIPVNTDRTSQTLIDSMASRASTLAPTTVLNFTQSNVLYKITAQEVITLSNQIGAHVQAARDAEAVCLTDLALATPTILTYADVEARFAGVLR